MLGVYAWVDLEEHPLSHVRVDKVLKDTSAFIVKPASSSLRHLVADLLSFVSRDGGG